MRIYTCTPRDYAGSVAFFSRDSGLVCRGLNAVGVESKAVMPGANRENDDASVLRTDYVNLESAEWWRQHNLDGVVLYAWARPRYRKVAYAIRDAGICLILNQDHGGIISPLNGLNLWMRQMWYVSAGKTFIRNLSHYARSILRGLTIGLFLTDPFRALHLRSGDWIACVSPSAVKNFKPLCRVYGGMKLQDKVILLPHPVEARFNYNGQAKQKKIVCLGRWSDHTQKRPLFMMAVIEQLLIEDDAQVEIMGAVTDELAKWYDRLDSKTRNLVCLRGIVSRSELAEVFAEAQIFYSSSAYESFGIAAAEALCSGCSVVASRLISMGSFEWFSEDGGGTLSLNDDVWSHVSALKMELREWEEGKRSPNQISERWKSIFHDTQVAKRVVELVRKA